MNRIEVNAQTGTRNVVELTDEEIREAQIRGAQEVADRALQPPSLEQRISSLEQWAHSMGYV